ncbi:hypothetical protein AmaxDRAFT_3439 [Limnospira maxima CS-328]|uniref:Uncharacterized protein n=2 Tax=Limnospira TaxID=2596745 RepID=A0A9P1KEX5_9CYAN|nr:hypothetical protein AmaxDRAFT_3439 [Limnospira maxima CS-328]UWU49026.1 hypothetical protein APLC1_3838 [Arthrospira platensis C1]CDM94939.1 hypothetical protein ARTHRO_30205 [Limnospira indica PCC 8005]
MVRHIGYFLLPILPEISAKIATSFSGFLAQKLREVLNFYFFFKFIIIMYNK